MKKIKRRKKQKEVELKKTLREILRKVHDLPFRITAAGHVIEKNWARFDYHIDGKRGEQIARITVMTTSPFKGSPRSKPFIKLSNNKIRKIKRRK